MRNPAPLLIAVAGALHTCASLGPDAVAGQPALSPQDLPAALSHAKPGDTLLVRDGEYRDRQLALRGRGTAERPITLRAATPGRVVLTGRSSVELRGAWVTLEGFVFNACTVAPLRLRDTEGCRVTGCAVIRCNPEDDTRIHWITVSGAASQDNRIDHCYAEGKLKDGVVLVVEGADGKMPQRTRIDHNHFKDVVRAVRNGMETVRVGTSTYGDVDSHTLVESNLFENASGDAEIISSKSCENVYRGNTFRGCDGGVVMRHGHRSVVEGNFFFGEGRRRSAGVRVHGSDHRVLNNYFEGLGEYSISLPAGQAVYVRPGHERTVNAVVAYNTVVDPAGPAVVIGAGRGDGGRDAAPENTLLANNLVTGSRAPLVQVLFGGTERWAGNLLFTAGGAQIGLPPGTSGVLLADPKLRRTDDGLLRPAADSLALGAAVPLPFRVERDVDGQPREGPPDIGADQRSSAPVTARPLRPRDVGPEWRVVE